MVPVLSKQLFGGWPEHRTGELLFFKLFESFILASAVLASWSWALGMPEGTHLLYPSGLAGWVDLSFLLGEHVATVAALFVTAFSVLAFFRIQPRWSFLLLVLLLHLLYVTRYSLGKLPHSMHYIGIALIGFALGFSFFKEQRPRIRFILGFVLFFLGLVYFSSALSKLVGTGINWWDGHHLWLWIAEKQVDQFSLTGIFMPDLLESVVQQNYWLATLFLAAGLLTEALGPLLWWPKTRPIIATAILGLHIGIGLTMDINFVGMASLVLLVGYPWPAIFEAVLRPRQVRMICQLRRLA